MMRLGVTIAVLLLLAPPTLAEEPVLEEKPAEVIATLIAGAAQALPENTLIVMPFPYADGINAIEGALLSERVAAALAATDAVRLVERAQLDRVMEEQRLSASGLVNPATAVRVGKLLGAGGIVAGTVTDLGEVIEIHVRLVNVETAEVLRHASIRARKTIRTFISPLWSRIESIQQAGDSFGIELWCESEAGPSGIPSRQIGEELTLHMRAETDCYVTVFDFATSGAVHVLFPNAFMRDNELKAGRTYTFPARGAGFKIRVKGPPGIERLKVFATARDVPLFEEDYARESFRGFDTNQEDSLRDLETVLDAETDMAWAEHELEIRIEQKYR